MSFLDDELNKNETRTARNSGLKSSVNSWNVAYMPPKVVYTLCFVFLFVMISLVAVIYKKLPKIEIDERHKIRSRTYTLRDTDDMSIYINDSSDEQEQEQEPSSGECGDMEYAFTTSGSYLGGQNRRRSIRRSSLGSASSKWKDECCANWIGKDKIKQMIDKEQGDDCSVMDMDSLDIDKDIEIMNETPEMKEERINMEILRRKVLKRRKEDRRRLNDEVEQRQRIIRNLKSSRRARHYKPKRTGRHIYLSTLEENPRPIIGTNNAPAIMEIGSSDIPSY